MPLFYSVPANQVRPGTFATGDFVFPSDVDITDTLRIGSTTPATGTPKTDVVGTVPQAVLSDVTTNAATKTGGLGVRHYTNTEEPITIFGGASLNGFSIVGFGGGNAGMNAVERLAFYTAADDVTTTGTECMRLDFSTTARDTRMMLYDVDNATLERVTVGIADSGGAGFKVLRIPN